MSEFYEGCKVIAKRNGEPDISGILTSNGCDEYPWMFIPDDPRTNTHFSVTALGWQIKWEEGDSFERHVIPIEDEKPLHGMNLDDFFKVV